MVQTTRASGHEYMVYKSVMKEMNLANSGRVRNQIDYMLVQQRFCNSVQCSKAIPGVDCKSDHSSVLCCMKIKLKCWKISKSGFKYQLDILRTDQNIKSQFSISVQNKCEIPQEVISAEEKLNLLKESIEKSLHEYIPIKTRK